MEHVARSAEGVRFGSCTVALFAVLVLFGTAACAGATTAPSAQSSGQPSVQAPGSGAGSAGTAGSTGTQVVVSGAVNGTFAVKRAWAADFPGDIRVQLDLDFLCSVWFGIPHQTQPGTYPIASWAADPTALPGAEYADGCHGNTDNYQSTTGSITLSATGPKWSGTYQFTGQNKDASKTVQVSGSFNDVSTQ